MNTKLLHYHFMENSIDALFAKKQELEASIRRQEDKILRLKTEHSDVLTAIAVMQKLGFAKAETDLDNDTPKTIGKMVERVLSESKDGLKALDILRIIQERWMPTLARTSLSPPLSRLKKDGHVEVNNEIWRITAKSKEPSAETQGSFAEKNVDDFASMTE